VESGEARQSTVFLREDCCYAPTVSQVSVCMCLHEEGVSSRSQAEIGGYFECAENQTDLRAHQTLHHLYCPTYYQLLVESEYTFVAHIVVFSQNEVMGRQNLVTIRQTRGVE